MTIENVRYYVEHEMLPAWFYQHRASFIVALETSKKNMAFQLMEELCNDHDIVMPYTEEQFGMSKDILENGSTILSITMPEPEKPTLCKELYFVFDRRAKKLGYYTVEAGCQDKKMLGGWDEKKQHSNYGDCPEEEEKLVQKIKEIYLESGRKFWTKR